MALKWMVVRCRGLMWGWCNLEESLHVGSQFLGWEIMLGVLVFIKCRALERLSRRKYLPNMSFLCCI